MRTRLAGRDKEVIVDVGGPAVVIGERINPTGHKKLAASLTGGDYGYIRELARNQTAAGADLLDVNVGLPGVDEVELLPHIIEVVASEVDVPLCVDSADREALAAALAVAPGRPLVNSVTGEEASLEAVLPIVKDRGAAVIGLTMDDKGIPADAETRMAIAGRILERAARLGLQPEDVIIDPLVLTVGADTNAAAVTLEAIELIRDNFGVSINLGASNVSFGLPERQVINKSFLALAMGAGANCLITDPMKFTRTILATDLLLGHDPYASRYIGHYRSQQDKGQA